MLSVIQKAHHKIITLQSLAEVHQQMLSLCKHKVSITGNKERSHIKLTILLPVTWPDCQNEIYNELLNLEAERDVFKSTPTGKEEERRGGGGGGRVLMLGALLLLYNDYLGKKHDSAPQVWLELIIT